MSIPSFRLFCAAAALTSVLSVSASGAWPANSAAFEGVSYFNLEAAPAADLPAVPEPVVAKPQPAGKNGPYYPGANEGQPSRFNSPIYNYGVAVDGVYRGGRLSKDEEFKFLKAAGVEVIVNLAASLKKDDPELCGKYGFNCAYQGVLIIPKSDIYFAMDDLKDAFRYTVGQMKGGKKIYIHCHFGRERTGILAAALLIREKMCSPESSRDAQAKEKTWTEVESKFKEFGYKMVYKKPFQEMKSWITDFERNEAWLCR